MPDPDDAWHDVDAYIERKLLGPDPALRAALQANTDAGLPPIDVSPAHGRMLQLFAQMAGARRVLEVGTLGGYSTICLARGLPDGGRVVTLEIDPDHAEVARRNLAAAGVKHMVEIRIGPAAASLEAMIAAGEPPFDLIFIDADKQNNAHYVRSGIALGRPGTVIVIDNVVRHGGVIDGASRDAMVRGTRRLYDYVAGEPRLEATAVQTVGAKGWDGFLLARIRD